MEDETETAPKNSRFSSSAKPRMLYDADKSFLAELDDVRKQLRISPQNVVVTIKRFITDAKVSDSDGRRGVYDSKLRQLNREGIIDLI